MTVSERQQSLIDEFSKFEDWEGRYKHIIEMGKALPEFPEELKTEDNRVKGCQSQVWISADFNTENGTINFSADSDALIVKGLVAVLLKVYSNSTPDEILTTPVDFLKQLGLQQHLSPSRANGLYSMLKQMLFYATAFKAKSSL